MKGTPRRRLWSTCLLAAGMWASGLFISLVIAAACANWSKVVQPTVIMRRNNDRAQSDLKAIHWSYSTPSYPAGRTSSVKHEMSDAELAQEFADVEAAADPVWLAKFYTVRPPPAIWVQFLQSSDGFGLRFNSLHLTSRWLEDGTTTDSEAECFRI